MVFRNVVPGPAVSASARSLLAVQILRPQPRHPEESHWPRLRQRPADPRSPSLAVTPNPVGNAAWWCCLFPRPQLSCKCPAVLHGPRWESCLDKDASRSNSGGLEFSFLQVVCITWKEAGVSAPCVERAAQPHLTRRRLAGKRKSTPWRQTMQPLWPGPAQGPQE